MKQFLHLSWEAAKLWYHKDADHTAASVSYYTLFAVVPLLLFTITIVSILYGKDFVVATLYDWGSVLGNEVLTLLTVAVQNLEVISNGFGISILGILLFSLMVIIMFNAFTSGLHNLWSLPYRGISGWTKKTKHSFIFLIIFEIYLLFLVGLSSVISFLINLTGVGAFKLIEPIFFVVATAVLFSLAYRILPWEAPSTKARLYGGLIASVLFAIAKSFVVLYINTTPIPGLFGAAGFILVILIWVYVTACILYYGAAFAHVYDKSLNNQIRS